MILYLNRFNLTSNIDTMIPLGIYDDTTDLRLAAERGSQSAQSTGSFIEDALASSPEVDDVARRIISITLSIVVRDNISMLSAMDVQLNVVRRQMADRTSFRTNHGELQSTIDNIWETTRSILVSTRECTRFVVATALRTSSTWRFSKIKKTLRKPRWDNEEARQIHGELEELLRHSERFKQDVMEVSDLLIGRMSLLVSEKQVLASQQQVQELESVTKLTELAFFFISISFSASIFGMEIKVGDLSSLALEPGLLLIEKIPTGVRTWCLPINLGVYCCWSCIGCLPREATGEKQGNQSIKTSNHGIDSSCKRAASRRYCSYACVLFLGLRKSRNCMDLEKHGTVLTWSLTDLILGWWDDILQYF